MYDIENDPDDLDENFMAGRDVRRADYGGMRDSEAQGVHGGAYMHDAARRGGNHNGHNRLLDPEAGGEHRSAHNRNARLKHWNMGRSESSSGQVDRGLASTRNNVMSHGNGAKAHGQSLVLDDMDSGVNCDVGDGMQEYACMPNAWSTPKEGNSSLKSRHFGEEQGI